MEVPGIAAVAALTCSLIIGQAGAFKQEDVNKLLDTNGCRNCDLSGAILTGATLSEADL